MIKVFISYSYDSKEHENWVMNLADDLEKYKELHVIFDKYDLTNKIDKNYFMEKGVYDSDVIVIVATKKYVEKANERIGGVGVETYMTSAKHWDEFVREKSSSTIFLLRENIKNIVPRYGKGKIYINFNNDSEYNVKIQELINAIMGIPRRNRPSKTKSIKKKEKLIQLDKIEEILSVNYKNLSLVDSETDYRQNNQIKYDLWEAKTPVSLYYLVLYDPNIIINQTIERFIENQKSIPSEITVLRSKSTGYIDKLFSEKKISVKINEFSFSEFMWDFCIDDTLKAVTRNYQDEYYIDQKIFKYINKKKKIIGTTNEYIDKFFINRTDSPAILLVLASGGMGKSTMCDVLLNLINERENQRAVLIKSEDFKSYNNQKFFKSFSVENVYDLYEVHSRINQSTGTSLFSKDLFDISFLCGNLIIVIDGLDELITIFQNNFNIKLFIKSLIDLNSQLGQAKIIVTSRENYWKENEYIIDNKEEIDEINLLGFDEETWEQYLSKRFKNFPKKKTYIKKIKKYIDITKISKDGIVIPFFVDVLSTLVVEESNHKTSKQRPKISFENRDYNSNENLIDYLVFVLLDREITRQGYAISLRKFISIFMTIASEYGSNFSVQNLQEVTEYYFGVSSEQIYNKMLVNPLLRISGNRILFKYDFLSNYFITLYLIDSIINNIVNKHSIRLLSYLHNGKDQIIFDVANYLLKSDESSTIHVKKMVSSLLIQYKMVDSASFKLKIEKAISSLMYLLQMSQGNSLTRTKRTEIILDIYGTNKNGINKIDYFFIWGDFFPIDFSNLQIWNSKFVNYSNFLKCKFDNTSFYYSTIDDVDISAGKLDVNKITFDSTCNIGELSSIIHNDNDNREKCRLAEMELKKFFRSFYERGTFRSKLIEQITFSSKNHKIDKEFLFMLVKDNFIEFDEIGKRYLISSVSQRSVHQLIVNNLVDHEIGQYVEYLCI